MENLWETIAKARGLELNEEFILCTNGLEYKHRITPNGLEAFRHEGWYCSYGINEFIRGVGVIEKLPFRPQKYGTYYTFYLNKEVTYSKWNDNSVDYARLIAGIVFRTREEAEANLPTWQERISKL